MTRALSGQGAVQGHFLQPREDEEETSAPAASTSTAEDLLLHQKRSAGTAKARPCRAWCSPGSLANKLNIYKAIYTQQHIRKSEATPSKTFFGINKSLFLQNKLGAQNAHRSPGR